MENCPVLRAAGGKCTVAELIVHVRCGWQPGIIVADRLNVHEMY